MPYVTNMKILSSLAFYEKIKGNDSFAVSFNFFLLFFPLTHADIVKKISLLVLKFEIRD